MGDDLRVAALRKTALSGLENRAGNLQGPPQQIGPNKYLYPGGTLVSDTYVGGSLQATQVGNRAYFGENKPGENADKVGLKAMAQVDGSFSMVSHLPREIDDQVGKTVSEAFQKPLEAFQKPLKPEENSPPKSNFQKYLDQQRPTTEVPAIKPDVPKQETPKSSDEPEETKKSADAE